jgi:hypothetical protein
MNWKDEELPALHELESAVLSFARRHDTMNDYTATRAYEAAYQHYRARLRGHPPKPPALDGLDLEAFNAVQTVCEKLLATGPAPMKGLSRGNLAPVQTEKLVEYLRELTRSVERHTKLAGRRGYLEFLEQYVR